MASPIMERIEPHKKAHFGLHISDRIANGDTSSGAYRSVKYNHKPAQTSDSRTTTLTSLSANTYNLKLEDSDASGTKDIFTFKGQGSTLKKSYVLVFDPSAQQATLEPLSSSYTFNLATKNGKDIASQHPRIYPKKYKDDTNAGADDEDLFGETAEDEAGDPDPANPYDFRHFLSKEKEKRGDESEYHCASSPDYRTGTGSAANTPQFGARSAAASRPKPTKPAPAKRKAPTTNTIASKTKKAQSTPAVVLQRKATSDAPRTKAKAAAPPASKIKSKEVIDSSDESDNDADGEIVSSPARRSPSPPRHHHHRSSSEDAEGESASDDDGGLLEIEVPDADAPRRGHSALKSLGLGQNLGVSGLTRSPSTGPRSLLSATNSAQGSPNPQSLSSRANRYAQDEIDFGDLEDAEGEDDDEEEEGYDRDVDPMDIGPPARHGGAGVMGNDRKASTVGGAVEDDEDEMEKMMLAGLAGDSSEESEEE